MQVLCEKGTVLTLESKTGKFTVTVGNRDPHSGLFQVGGRECPNSVLIPFTNPFTNP